jgi:hypothetical protein
MTEFEQFNQFFEQLGLYGSHRRPLWTLRMEGAFEGWTGRATEDMEHHYFIEEHEFSRFRIPSIRVDGRTIDEVASKALQEIERIRQFYIDQGWTWGQEP